MPEASNRIFVSIAVSKPGGGLDPLPGAITAAKRMAAWAQAQGYATLLLHDEALPEITIDVLRKALSAAIGKVTDGTDGVALERLVVFFAGHGAALGIGDQYWILTHWHKRSTEAIKVSSLQRMLEYYGPRQVAIIGDACQEFSSRFIDLIGSAVLDKPDEEQQPYELDQFFAVDVGKQAFMVKASGERESFCVFTEVLLDALEGDTEESCFEQLGADRQVTSQSLARYLASNVEREAGKYGVRMRPRPMPGFYTDRTYLTLPTHPPDPLRPAGQPPVRAVRKAMLLRPGSASAALAVQAAALGQAREARQKEIADTVKNTEVRFSYETGCGICVSGDDVLQVQASSGEVSAVDGHPNWFRLRLDTFASHSLGWADTLVTLTEGRVVPVCAVNGFIATLHLMDPASTSLLHRPLGVSEDEIRQAIDLLAQLHAGLLSPQKTIDLAALLRQGHLRTITLGCVAAQYYDAVRDVDSLRSLAAFHAMQQQPVPLDIVLYGGGTLHASGGCLYADIPAVAACETLAGQECRPRFSCDPSPAFPRWPVAGRIPWMRRAWDAVVTARCDASAEDWRAQALAAMDFLEPGLFTTVRAEGHAALARLAGIQAPQQAPAPFAVW